MKFATKAVVAILVAIVCLLEWVHISNTRTSLAYLAEQAREARRMLDTVQEATSRPVFMDDVQEVRVTADGRVLFRTSDGTVTEIARQTTADGRTRTWLPDGKVIDIPRPGEKVGH